MKINIVILLSIITAPALYSLGFGLQTPNPQAPKPNVSQPKFYRQDDALRPHLENNKTITIGCWQAGLLSGFLGVVGNLKWCDRKNVTPIVYWEDHSYYYQPEGYNGSTNVWEYYFEPVSSELWAGQQPDTRNYRAPDGTGVKFLCKHTYEYRVKTNNIIEKYIRIKQPIIDKVEQFYQTNMAGKTTIAIHLRGTDKPTEITMPTAEVLLYEANRQAEKFESVQFLVATDEAKLLQLAQKMLKGPVINYNSYKATDGRALHTNAAIANRAQLGEEVLIECLLLSRSQLLIHSHSNVAYCAYFFNPELKTILIDGRVLEAMHEKS